MKIFLFLIYLSVVFGHHDKYEGHRLYRIIGSKEDISTLEPYLDVLGANPSTRTAPFQLEAIVRIAPEDVKRWTAHFEARNISSKLISENLADILREEEFKVKRAKRLAKEAGLPISWDTYYEHDEINDYLDQLAIQYPNLLTVVNPGLSYEGRQIKYVKISTSNFEDVQKPVIVIDAAVHAREWVTPPVALYIINQLVVDIIDSTLTDRLDWIIIPVANPDGYQYSIKEDRMWRKTRSKNHAGADACPGVDGNRNFDHYWGTTPSSADPCTIVYEGPSPFSEPEIRVIRDVVLEHLQRTAMYISLHSYGNMFLYAWGNNGTLPPKGLFLHVAGIRMAEEIDTHALDKADRYIVGNAANVLYFTTGTSRDWTRAVGVPFTYTLELPGYEYGFLVPPEYVKQIVTETWAGIAEGAKYVLSLYNN